MSAEKFMREAIEDAKESDHRFGAVLVRDNTIIARAGRRPKSDARFHAESSVILKTGKDLQDCTLYSTCEPCIMCYYLAWTTGISKIVYGATIKDSIAVGIPEVDVSVEELNKRNMRVIELQGDILRDECISLLKEEHKFIERP